MLSKPKFMKPSTNMTECTVDINADELLFSCIVDGNEGIKYWQIRIYNLETNTEVLNTRKETLSPEFFPIDENNRNVLFTQDLNKYLANSPDLKNANTPYYWTIQLWTTTGATTTSCEEVFYANSSPTLTISCNKDKASDTYVPLTEGAVLTSKEYYFKATYGQDEGVAPLKRYGWRLKDKDDGQILLDTITSNQIYGTKDNIICSYDGFLDRGNYSVELYVETQNNTVILTEPINFTVKYETMFLTKDFKVEALKNEPAIILDWNESVIIGGKMVSLEQNETVSPDKIQYKSDYPIVGKDSKSVVIPFKHCVTFDYGSNSNLDIPESAYIVLSTQLHNGNNKTIFVSQGVDDSGLSIMRELTYTNGAFVYVVISEDKIIAEETYTPEYKPCEYVWYIITMAPGDAENPLTVVESHTANGLYPSSSLYPSSEEYPTFGTWTN